MGLETFPSEEYLEGASRKWPEFMRPNTVPYAAWYEGLLPADECDAIIEKMINLSGYKSEGCGGVTRECHADPVLDTIEATARGLNALYWEYDLDPGQHSWFQSYERGSAYRLHMDGSPGQMRKLTAVALLTDPAVYSGGDLRFEVEPKSQWIPRTRGTVVVFQPWLLHEVLPVSSGHRQTINMGFWGPPFK